LDCCEGTDSMYFGTGNAADKHSYFGGGIGDQPDLIDGEAPRAPDGTNSNTELLLSATIEQDADHYSNRDETQDQCPTDPSTHGPCPDKTAPDTSITKGPKAKLKTRKKKAKATFEFSSDDFSASFRCSLDGTAFAPCAAPDAFKVKAKRRT